LNRLLSANKERFYEEKEGLLEVALTQADYITVDDSGARHKGKTATSNIWVMKSLLGLAQHRRKAGLTF
jgi:hypothetical protein